MTIIAIDPGPEESAFVCLLDGAIRDMATLPNDEMLLLLRNPSNFYIRLVIEEIACMGMSVGQTVFTTAFWSGRFCEAWANGGRRFYQVKRAAVKMHLCGSMRAKDANIRTALIDKLGPPGKKKSPGPTFGISGHCWAALAVGITFLETRVIFPNHENTPDPTTTPGGTLPARTADLPTERPEALPQNQAQHSDADLLVQTKASA